MSKEIPYQLSVNQLKDALDHVMRLAKASRSQTKRLKVIAARADMALNGEVYEGKDLKLPKEARAPMSYEIEIRVTKRELAAALEREQALVAHVETLSECLRDMSKWQSHVDPAERQAALKALDSNPVISLARRDALNKAEAMDWVLAQSCNEENEGVMWRNKIVEPEIQRLRRQAEGTQCEEGTIA